ncbi:hypothetical protein [Nostoc sp. ChiQUE01b]|uniref:hypothetical protein n=1 Tax=Nostoc sp. ChiQUE01b TaxID=3075376 RepID=UPI002AD3A5EE|nr:hypothetical protein [Nostoc sp. ChiQUE01b]MDZ8257227.1 hypothetical protein [Nostoc sp. ChiQUE01b]
MRLMNWKNVFFCILLTSSGGTWCCIRVNAAESAITDVWHPNNLATTQLTHEQLCHKLEQKAINSLCKLSSESNTLDSQMPLNLAQQTPETTQTPDQTKEPIDTQKQNDPPQLESQPNNVPISPSDSKEQILNLPEIEYSQRLERLIELLRSPKQPFESDSDRELGLRVRLRPLEQQLPLPIEQPVPKFKPIGYLQGRVGYFQTSNIFSSNDSPIEDGLIISGLTLASTYFPLGSKTFVNGSIDGNLIRYINQSQYHYNQVRFNLSIYQQLSQQMFGEISWSNQQLFYANSSDRFDSFKAGDRFLNENSLQLSLGRRDPLTSRLTLDSFYQLSVNFADPQSRNRIINSFWVSLNYYLQKPLQVGIDYQMNLSDFTQRDREDEFYRLFGHLNYQISDTINMNMEAGVSLGSSTAQNIDFDGWFFTINYSFQLGRF